jgi:hypothetical protein
MKYNSVIMTLQIKDMANFIMHILVEFFFSDSYLDLNSNAVIMKTAWGSHFWFDRLSWSHSSCDRSVFFPGTPVSSFTNTTDILDITEILLKLALSTLSLTLTCWTCISWYTLCSTLFFVWNIFFYK